MRNEWKQLKYQFANIVTEAKNKLDKMAINISVAVQFINKYISFL